jgi:hypothetical protein
MSLQRAVKPCSPHHATSVDVSIPGLLLHAGETLLHVHRRVETHLTYNARRHDTKIISHNIGQLLAASPHVGTIQTTHVHSLVTAIRWSRVVRIYSKRGFNAHARTLQRYLNMKIEIMQLSMVAMDYQKGQVEMATFLEKHSCATSNCRSLIFSKESSTNERFTNARFGPLSLILLRARFYEFVVRAVDSSPAQHLQ